jgi:hypothetical protein
MVQAGVRKEQPAQFFMFFVDAGDGFFEMAINCVGLKLLSRLQKQRHVGLYLLLDGLGQTIGLNLQIMTHSCKLQNCHSPCRLS